MLRSRARASRTFYNHRVGEGHNNEKELYISQTNKTTCTSCSKGEVKMKVSEATEQIERLQLYVSAYEGYEATTMKQIAVKTYAELNNVSKVTSHLNDLGYRKQGRVVAGKTKEVKLETNDVTDILNGPVDEGDQLHELVKKILRQNRKRKGVSV